MTTLQPWCWRALRQEAIVLGASEEANKKEISRGPICLTYQEAQPVEMEQQDPESRRLGNPNSKEYFQCI
jgi:hypothetical protein